MKVVDYRTVTAEPVEVEGAKDVKVRWLIAKKDQAENFAMRLFEVSPGGHTPYHTHDWEHEVFVVEGEGEVQIDGQTYPVKKDTVVFVEPNQKHCFKNTGEGILKFICLIPYK